MDSSQLGLGLKNSNLMAGADPSADNAAVRARGYRGGTKTDWYLPTLAEARLLCQYARGQTRSLSTACDYAVALNTGVPTSHTFSAASYQSSSQSDNAISAQWHANFVSLGSDNNTAEHSTWGYALDRYATRPIRAFAQEKFACGTSGTFTVINNVVTGNTSCTGSAVVPEGVTALGTSFYNSAVSEITLPSTLVTIGDSALRETQLTSVVIPASVTSIGYLSLASRFITSVTFASGSQLTTIGNYAFQSTKFTSISIPASVASIGTGAFELNPNLATINFLGSIPSGQPWDAPVGATVSKVTCDGSSRTCAVGENGPGGGTIYY
jgi:hypothetical protein